MEKLLDSIMKDMGRVYFRLVTYWVKKKASKAGLLECAEALEKSAGVIRKAVEK